MKTFFEKVAIRIWPTIETLEDSDRVFAIGEVYTILYSLPFALIGWGMLFFFSEFAILQQQWPLFLLFAGLMFVFSRLNFFMVVELKAGQYANSNGSLDGIVLWTALFVLGPMGIWLFIIWSLFEFVQFWRGVQSEFGKWSLLRNLMLSHASNVPGILLGLAAYSALGGVFPFSEMSFAGLLPGFVAIFINFCWLLLMYTGFLVYHFQANALGADVSSVEVFRFMLLSLGLPPLAHPFGILAAGIYTLHGVAVFLFFIVGLLLVAFMARQLSLTAENNRQQSRQLERLEQLGRAILNAPPDMSTLPDILQEHIPPMFPSGRVVVFLHGDEFLLTHPVDWQPNVDRFWVWMQTEYDVHAVMRGDSIPWRQDEVAPRPIVVGPIYGQDFEDPIGGIYIELQNVVQTWTPQTLRALYPAVRSLAAQIASALAQAETYEEALEHQQVVQELKLAGDIQASFLPNELPILPGWELAVTILPARETSGDFFDFIPLTDGRLGVLIADVMDKGVGPALYMALSRTLIRTYAVEYEAEPDVVFFAANDRILKDARANLFVTAFYGVLDEETGVLTYSNAGHNPPYLFRSRTGEVVPLGITGMPIGIESNTVWGTASIELETGDVLLLYTDGIPDAQNEAGEFFEEQNLVENVKQSLGVSAHDIQANLMRELDAFMGNADQFDDITLMVLSRDIASQNGTPLPLKDIPDTQP